MSAYVDRLSMATNPSRPELAVVLVAQTTLENAIAAYRVASEGRRRAVHRAVAAGASHREIAEVLGVSRVKVTQLVNKGEEQ